MRRTMLTFSILLTLATQPAYSFCGFYVAKADTKLFNQASQVALVRDGDRTVMTMANDYQGTLKEFAVVIPVPTFIKREQIHVGDKALIDHLDAYTAPRLVEYFDENPCERRVYERMMTAMPQSAVPAPAGTRAKSLGVTIEAQYTIGEYDILILSATQSDGLETWLKENGYKIPAGASAILGSYIKQNMHFFVAKVNLEKQSQLGYSYLRPLQIAYESPKFMLPIRLGTVNSKGTQELFIYTLSRKGRVETTNYRTVKLPTDTEIPVYVKNEFPKFYTSMFDRIVRKEDMRVVFLEYAWDMNWCDPCAADPLTEKELRQLGVFWLGEANEKGQSRDVFVTRLHVRYDAAHFPEDLVFQTTADRENFQGRFVLRHPWKGNDSCSEAKEYRKQLPKRYEQEAQTLARLTGWDINEIRNRMNIKKITAAEDNDDDSWWTKIWKD